MQTKEREFESAKRGAGFNDSSAKAKVSRSFSVSPSLISLPLTLSETPPEFARPGSLTSMRLICVTSNPLSPHGSLPAFRLLSSLQ